MANKIELHAVESNKTKAANFVVFVLLLLLAVFTVYPIVYIILGSFKGNQELVSGGLNLLPQHFILDNYIQAWKIGNFSVYTCNSVFLAAMVTLITLFTTSMAGYVFARKNFHFKNLIYNIMLLFMFVNVGSVSLRPLFELAIKIHMNTSLWAVVLIEVGTEQAIYVFLIRGFMNTVPKELDEAAMIDGCSFFGTYFRIILPVLRPALATVGLLSFRGAWNEYILPLVFTMTNDKLRPLTVGVLSLQNAGDGAAAWNILFAGSAISIAPIVIVYIFASKQFISGITSGSVKG
jgi:ABC-type glycerol-3-phosphate transport system permease component